MNTYEGKLQSKNSKIAIIISRFNSFINKNLLDGAIDSLKRIGRLKSENISIFWVPGVCEIPIIVNFLSKQNKYNGLITLGTVIQGKTFHHELISKDFNNIIFNISIKKNIPISVGVLYTRNINQAIERSGTKLGNKGSDAALSVLEMINLLKII
ncbi:ribH [Wigglesworthia glossinidia endosymbiont of Glossina brevipalpis]|uniref:6,7-dimethyl-8-ribityllumazine synthase n=1 Tax=Wigglesworthia glossinidia brevipalpis TaxID=36870 RepID=RISB_WIGBR|nr:RecName: Full=6,7-dimethyl-8-ribityllumazine synthase; Short=DMRL synthase; Short=LS; Short=Lumazine synthase [Wigglesworthia glossinidia endosymbiont of Glossina brevipalpis]BAC24609.1 ribH [Wigglesworthia glossinidia endosymbiont of Glossina brevipalpis]